MEGWRPCFRPRRPASCKTRCHRLASLEPTCSGRGAEARGFLGFYPEACLGLPFLPAPSVLRGDMFRPMFCSCQDVGMIFLKMKPPF